MGKEVEKPPKVLLQDNELSKSVYTLKAYQNLAYLSILYQAQKCYQRSEVEFSKEKNYPVELDYLEMKEMIPDKRKRHYKEVKKLLETLRDTPIYRKGIEALEEEEATMIEDFMLDEHGNMTVFLNGIVIRQIVTHSSYTALNLSLMQNLKTFKAQRLYETLRFWSQPKEYRNSQEYTVDQLRELLGVENKYAAYKEFKRNILKKAMEEIGESGNMQISMQEIKHRVNQVRVEKIKFTIFDLEPRSYAKNRKKVRKEESNQVKKREASLPLGLPLSQQVYDAFSKDSKDCNEYLVEGIKKRQLEEAIGRTLKQLNVTKITMKQYAYFKVVLKNIEETTGKTSGLPTIDQRKQELLNRKKQLDMSLNMEVVTALRTEEGNHPSSLY